MSEPSSGKSRYEYNSAELELKMINLELSNLCNLNCGFCLRRAYDNEGKNQIMKLELLERILPELNQLEMIDLTGWGEPMAHPEFELCLEKIRKNFSGFLSLTSNGTLLDEEKIQALIDAQVNIICFSLDASSSTVYQARRGGSWEKVEKGILELVKKREQSQNRLPKIYASYLLMRSYLADLYPFARKMAEWGIDGILFQQMGGVFQQEDLKEITYSGYYGEDFPDAELFQAIEKIRADFQGRLEVIFPERIYSQKQGGCGAFSLTQLFIKANGEASPCCALAYSVQLLNRQKELVQFPAYILGDIKKQSLWELWSGEQAKAFRTQMQEQGFADACQDCIGLYLKREQ